MDIDFYKRCIDIGFIITNERLELVENPGYEKNFGKKWNKICFTSSPTYATVSLSDDRKDTEKGLSS